MKNIIMKINGSLAAMPYSILGLLARFIPATIFWRSGMTKIDDFEKTIDLFKEIYALPIIPHVPAAYMATAAELTLPILLVLGLCTRLSALALLLMTLVIQIFVFPTSYLEHGLWAVCFLCLIKFGAGLFSIDALIAKKMSKN
jgi:putative oxidoreductase